MTRRSDNAGQLPLDLLEPYAADADRFIDGPWRATVLAPLEWITANKGSEHWAVRARKVKAWRAAGLAAAHQADLPQGLDRVHLAIVANMPRRSRLRDVENLRPTVKAAIDGLVGDYGLAADDSDKHVEGIDLRRGAKETDPAEPGRLEITITRKDPTP